MLAPRRGRPVPKDTSQLSALCIPDLPKKSAIASLKDDAKNFIFQSATMMQPVSSLQELLHHHGLVCRAALVRCESFDTLQSTREQDAQLLEADATQARLALPGGLCSCSLGSLVACPAACAVRRAAHT